MKIQTLIPIGVVAILLLGSSHANAQSSRWVGADCGSSFSYNESVSVLEAEARRDSARVNYLSDTTFTATDSGGCTITITGLASGGGGGVPAAGDGSSPSSPATLTAERVVRNRLFKPAKPKAAPEAAPGEGAPPVQATQSLGFGGADVFYNAWEAGAVEGETFGANPSVALDVLGGSVQIMVPIHVSQVDDGLTYYTAGVDLSADYPLGFMNFLGTEWSLGGHVNGLVTVDDDENDTFYNINGGPFLSVARPITDDFIVSAGALLDYYSPEEGDSHMVVAPGVNLGYSITRNLAVNAYGIYFEQLDSDVAFDSYASVGGDLSIFLSSWVLQGGAKTTVLADDYDAIEGYLGTGVRF